MLQCFGKQRLDALPLLAGLIGSRFVHPGQFAAPAGRSTRSAEVFLSFG
jgi:hypothetical protein